MKRIACIAIALGLLLATQTVSADLVATVRIDPASQEVTVGETVSVNIVAEDIEGLSSWSLTLDYDDTILEFQNWEYGSWGSDGGNLATVTFLAVGTGTSQLPLTDVVLYDWTGAEIPYETQDGSVTVGEESTPVPTETPTLTPTETSTPVPTETATYTPTPADTETATPTETATFTPTPTYTPYHHPDTPTPTWTPVSAYTPTFTPVPTETFTPVPTETPTVTATFTPIPTSTFTPLPTATFTPVPTSTFTPTPTCTYTPAPTSTWTPTPVPPTSTARPSGGGGGHTERTETPAPSPTSSRTPVPTVSEVLPLETVVIVPPPTGDGGYLPR